MARRALVNAGDNIREAVFHWGKAYAIQGSRQVLANPSEPNL
jgi:hypothetical protein